LDTALESVIVEWRELKVQGQYRRLDLEYLAADAAISSKDVRHKLQLADAYIERMEWEYRHREAYRWAERSLERAHAAHEYDHIGRAVRSIAHQLFTEVHKPQEGLRFVTRMMDVVRGSASLEIVAREAADRLAQAGMHGEAQEAVNLAIDSARRSPSKTADPRYLRATFALAEGRYIQAVDAITGTRHSDPYMTTFSAQVEAEAHHALGDRRMVESEGYRASGWKWRSSFGRSAN
jgi:hypothetical protein